MSEASSLSVGKITVLLLTLVFFVAPVRAQDPTPNTAPGNLENILQQTAQQVLGSCQSWPPRLAISEKDRTKPATDTSKLKDGTIVITSQLAGSLSLDNKMQPFIYRASFLRLLDSVGTFDPSVPDKQLLGIGVRIDPSQLNLWGLDQFTVKHDCMSLLALVGKAGANYSIPFFSLDAAFQATKNISSNQVSTFILGTFQSPYEKLSDPKADSSQRLFAALKALNWRLNATDATKNQYVSTVHVLAINKNLTTSESASVLATLKAGVNFQIVNASGSIAGQLGNSLQTNGDSYITYFWDYKMGRLPEVNALVDTVSQMMGQVTTDITQVTQTNTLTATGSISGWPGELCNDSLWKLKTAPNFSPGQLEMKKVNTTSPFEQCSITASFSLAPATVNHLNAQPAVAVDVSNPGLSLEYAQNQTVKIPIRLLKPLYLAGKPSIKLDSINAKWATSVDPNTGAKSNLKWVLSGRIDVPSGRVISSISPGDFTCQTQETKASPLTLSGVQVTRMPTAADSAFTMDVLLSLTGVPSYDDDLNQASKQSCVISGSVRVSTTAAGGISPQTDSVSVQSNLVYYPNPLPTKVPAPPTNVTAAAGNAQVSLSWTAASNATSYNVYRSTTAGAETTAPAINKVPLTSNSFVDTGLTNGTTYFYVVRAVNAVGQSENSVEITAAPKQ